MSDEFYDALEAYQQAMDRESLADPDFIDVAIEETNAAKDRLNAVCKKAKLEAQKKSEQANSRLQHIFSEAKKFGNSRDYLTYGYFKRQLESLNLKPKEYEQAIIKIARILGV